MKTKEEFKIDNNKLKRVIDAWYSKQIDCLDMDKAKESKAELFLRIKEISGAKGK